MEKDTSAIHSDYAAAKIEQNDTGATTNFYVRRLNESDAAKFRAVRLEAITKTNLFVSLFTGKPDVPPAITEAEQPLSVWESLLIPSDSSSYFGAFDEERLIAIGKAYADPIDASGKTLGIGAGYVLENYRKRGVITLLFEGVLAWARENKFEHIVCQCRMDNEPIKNFLRKSGFIQTGTEMGRMCTGEIVEGFRMERALDIPSYEEKVPARNAPLPEKVETNHSSPAPT